MIREVNIMKNFKMNFANVSAKLLILMAIFFSFSPCAGKMYEPKLPDKLKK